MSPRRTLFVLSALFFTCSPSTPLAKPEACEAVNCDCIAISEGKWRDVCVARERQVVDSCNGWRTIYCGLHGPNASPVATFIQGKDRPDLEPKVKFKSLVNRVDIQTWSLQDDFEALKQQEGVLNPSQLLKVLGVLEQSAKELFTLQQKVVLGYFKAGREKAGIKNALSFASSAEKIAFDLETYGNQLWSNKRKKPNENEMQLILSVAREGVVAHERVATLYSHAKEYERSATVWESVSDDAQKVLAWEGVTRKRVKDIQFYREQRFAHLNRALLNLIKLKDSESITALLDKLSGNWSEEEKKAFTLGEARESEAEAVEATRPSKVLSELKFGSKNKNRKGRPKSRKEKLEALRGG